MFRYFICFAVTNLWIMGTNDLSINLGEPVHIEQSFSEHISVGKTAWDTRQGQSLTRADVDRDGAADLIAGYAMGKKGLLMLYRGNAPYSLKQDDAAFQEQEFLAELPVVPHYLFAVDVDGDGGEDLIVAAQDDERMYLLPGNAKGNFGEPQVWELDGPLQTMLAADLLQKDHIDDVAVVTAQEDGARLHIFKGTRMGLTQISQQMDLPSPQAAMTYGDANGDSFKELVVASGQELRIYPGQRLDFDLERPWSQSLDAPVAQLQFNHRGTKGGPHLHLLTVDGSLQTTALSVPEPGVAMKARLPWKHWDQFEERVAKAPMVVAHTITRPGKAVSLIDQKRLHLYSAAGDASLTLDLPTEARAALGMRMNGDALHDLVILDKTGELWTMRSKAAATFMVTTTADERDGTCNAHCSFYDAIIGSEGSGGLDTISFAALAPGDNSLIITEDLPKFFDPITIDGTTHPDGIVFIAEVNLEFLAGSNTVKGMRSYRLTSGGNTYYFQGNGDNVFQGNIVGLDNVYNSLGSYSIRTKLIDNNLFGGTGPGEGNVFAANLGGIGMEDGQFSTVQGNLFGLDPDGITLTDSSVGVSAHSNALIGGVDAGAANVFANTWGGASAGQGSSILGNYFGTDITGTIPLETEAQYAFSIGFHAEIGGSHANAGNFVHGAFRALNARDIGSLVQGNTVGALGNGTSSLQYCLYLNLANDGSVIVGGHGMGEANTFRGMVGGIMANDGNGVVDWSGNSFGNHSERAIMDRCTDFNVNNCLQGPWLQGGIDVDGNFRVRYGMVDYPGGTLTAYFYKGDGTDVPAGQIVLGQDTYVGGEKVANLGSAAALGVAIGDQLVGMVVDSEGRASFFSNISLIAATEDLNLTVTSTADTDDGTCDADCTLREAINHINNNPDYMYQIEFNLPGAGPFEITPNTALPQILATVEIDGASQSGYAGTPLVHLRGHMAGGSSAGLITRGDYSSIRGLAVSEFAVAGIYVYSDYNTVEANYVGTDSTGTTALGNGVGIWLRRSFTTVGSRDMSKRNIISGNDTGIYNQGENNTIIGNYIGTDATGTSPLGNTKGIESLGYGAIIGTGETSAGNLISGNTGTGIDIRNAFMQVLGNKIGTDITGTVALGNHTGIITSERGVPTGLGTIGDGTEEGRNLVSGNVVGIDLLEGSVNVNHNYIGTNANGDAAIANTSIGIRLNDGTNTGAISSNLISGNDVGMVCDSFDNGYTFSGNFVGTNAAGDAAVGNNTGIQFLGSGDSFIGDTHNVISGNIGYGIEIDSTSSVDIHNCMVGIDSSGTNPVPNGHGILVQGSINAISHSTVSGNTGNGIVFDGATNFSIRRSEFGTNVHSSIAIPNGLDGAVFRSSGPGDVRTSTFSGNVQSGLHLESGNTDIRIDGNYVGTGPTNEVLPNGEHGLLIDGSTNTRVGESLCNVFAHNTGDGIRVLSGTQNRFLEFQTYNNGGMGIDLGGDGVTPNDVDDTDSGPNNLQNYPLLENLTNVGGVLNISGSINSTPFQVLTIRLFISSGDPSGYGEGDTYLGQIIGIVTDADGNASFNGLFNGALAAGESVTAIATDGDGNSSEFAKNFGGEIFSDGFESGDLSAWNVEPEPLAPNGSLEVRFDAAMEDYFGLRVTMGAGNPTMVRDESPSGIVYYRARFYLRTDDLVLPDGESFDIFAGYGGSDDVLFRVALTGTASGHQIEVYGLDNGNWSVPLSQIIGSGPQFVELEWAAGNGNSSLQASLNGTLIGGVNVQSNEGGLVHAVRLGLVDGLDAGTSGYLDLDGFVSTETNLEIGATTCFPNPDWQLSVANWPSETVLDLIPLTNTVCN